MTATLNPGAVVQLFCLDARLVQGPQASLPPQAPSNCKRFIAYNGRDAHPAVKNWFRNLFGTRPMREATMVLLGQTGSGKTSFLNLLCNFPIVIGHGRNAFDGHLKDFRSIEFENKVGDNSASKTSAATTYVLQFDDLTLNIVDTPGFGDTRGQQFDKKHAQMIVDCIKKLTHVHSIVLVMSGRDARMTTQLKYVLTEICAILPKGARHNIVTVFTNTANPVYLTFDIETLSSLVEHTIPPERQIFIENPFVLWERSMKHQGKVPSEQLKMGLERSFQDAAENLQNFYKAVSEMPRLNTKDFETLYNLRKNIESNTVDVLAQLANVQETKLQLEQLKRDIAAATNEEKMNEKFEQTFTGLRWVFKDADRHGTFCGAKDCHSNCHAPCKMEKSFVNEKFKKCSAFRLTKTAVPLESPGDRDRLLKNFRSERRRFHTDEDGGVGTQRESVLVAQWAFSFSERSFLQDAMILASTGTSVGWADTDNMNNLCYPCQVTVADESDQDTCKKCGHSRTLHYHDEKIWVQESYTETVVDEASKAKYRAAKDLRAKKEEAIADIHGRIERCEDQQRQLSKLC
eukprot:TRINITY_DN42888_c0_g2_i3.p1 TRINITY_DN42888_c0_g2~~TRINITY_DN42888_c0_g2_i3.p1  ORF type:complete len:574 (-),score=104.66 TRINITY_DN42888_c0_g2_i3:866-2587(-)